MKFTLGVLIAAALALATAQTADAGPARGNNGNSRVIVVRNTGGNFHRGGVGSFRSFGYGGVGFNRSAFFAPSYGYGYATPVVVQQPLATFVAPIAPVQQFVEPAYAPTVVTPAVVAAPVLVPTYNYGYGYGAFRSFGYGGVGRTVIIRR